MLPTTKRPDQITSLPLDSASTTSRCMCHPVKLLASICADWISQHYPAAAVTPNNQLLLQACTMAIAVAPAESLVETDLPPTVLDFCCCYKAPYECSKLCGAAIADSQSEACVGSSPMAFNLYSPKINWPMCITQNSSRGVKVSNFLSGSVGKAAERNKAWHNEGKLHQLPHLKSLKRLQGEVDKW